MIRAGSQSVDSPAAVHGEHVSISADPDGLVGLPDELGYGPAPVPGLRAGGARPERAAVRTVSFRLPRRAGRRRHRLPAPHRWLRWRGGSPLSQLTESWTFESGLSGSRKRSCAMRALATPASIAVPTQMTHSLSRYEWMSRTRSPRASRRWSARSATSTALPPIPADPWCTMIRLCGSARRVPGAPEDSRSGPVLHAIPNASVLTSLRIIRKRSRSASIAGDEAPGEWIQSAMSFRGEPSRAVPTASSRRCRCCRRGHRRVLAREGCGGW